MQKHKVFSAAMRFFSQRKPLLTATTCKVIPLPCNSYGAGGDSFCRRLKPSATGASSAISGSGPRPCESRTYSSAKADMTGSWAAGSSWKCRVSVRTPPAKLARASSRRSLPSRICPNVPSELAKRPDENRRQCVTMLAGDRRP
jgi:hypothetical protein